MFNNYAPIERIFISYNIRISQIYDHFETLQQRKLIDKRLVLQEQQQSCPALTDPRIMEICQQRIQILCSFISFLSNSFTVMLAKLEIRLYQMKFIGPSTLLLQGPTIHPGPKGRIAQFDFWKCSGDIKFSIFYLKHLQKLSHFQPGMLIFLIFTAKKELFFFSFSFISRAKRL